MAYVLPDFNRDVDLGPLMLAQAPHDWTGTIVAWNDARVQALIDAAQRG